MYNRITTSKRDPYGMASLFTAGFKEFARLRQHNHGDPSTILDGTQRAMRVALSREIDDLEQHLSFLATVGSTSPYIGLFGTVWGIYHALVGISAAGNITIEKISGPVGEALIMTAAGLAVAIPAVLAYNVFGKLVAASEADLEGFAHDLRELLDHE
jgi:biopolymer transport protein ExbB